MLLPLPHRSADTDRNLPMGVVLRCRRMKIIHFTAGKPTMHKRGLSKSEATVTKRISQYSKNLACALSVFFYQSINTVFYPWFYFSSFQDNKWNDSNKSQYFQNCRITSCSVDVRSPLITVPNSFPAYWTFYGYNHDCDCCSGERDAWWEFVVVKVTAECLLRLSRFSFHSYCWDYLRVVHSLRHPIKLKARRRDLRVSKTYFESLSRKLPRH